MTKTIKRRTLLFSLMIICVLTILFSSISLSKSAFAEGVDGGEQESITAFQDVTLQTGLGLGINVINAKV